MLKDYWEVYDDQSAEDFDELSYKALTGEEIRVPVEENLEAQVHEIRRKNGADVEIYLFKR